MFQITIVLFLNTGVYIGVTCCIFYFQLVYYIEMIGLCFRLQNEYQL